MRIRKNKPIIKKKKKSRINSIGNKKLNSIKVLICEALVYSNISHDDVICVISRCEIMCYFTMMLSNAYDKYAVWNIHQIERR